jgi:hypothetical protein
MSSGSSNPEIEPQWLALAEEALIFSDRLVSEKFNDIDSSPSEEESDSFQASSKSTKSPDTDDAVRASKNATRENLLFVESNKFFPPDF